MALVDISRFDLGQRDGVEVGDKAWSIKLISRWQECKQPGSAPSHHNEARALALLQRRSTGDRFSKVKNSNNKPDEVSSEV